MLNARKSGYEVELISARDDQNVFVKDAIEKGYNLDDGMVIFTEENVFFGSQAAHFIAMISTSSKIKYLAYKLFFT